MLALLTAVAGYAVTALITLQLLAIPVGQLLLGGAITGTPEKTACAVAVCRGGMVSRRWRFG